MIIDVTVDVSDVTDLTEDGQLIVQDGKEPYGDVEYADPGYQPDKKKRYPLSTKEFVKAGWGYINKAKNAAKYTASQLASIKSKIVAAAKKFGIEISQETLPERIEIPLLLEENGTPGYVIIQEPTAEGANGVMRVRVPFYRSGSLTRAPGFSKRLLFDADLGKRVVQEGQQRIDSGKQPLTVYARHAHASSGVHLPIGGVVGLEFDGSTGYGILEIVPTSDGRDAQTLVQHGHVRSVSLRSDSNWDMEPIKVDGESALHVKVMQLEGIDLAPNRPAQDTYGMQILNEGAEVTADTDVEPVVDDPDRRNHLDPITLENVPADVRQQIEAPIRQELERVTAERDQLTQERTQRELSDYVAEIAAKSPKPDETRQVLQDLAKEKGCTTRGELSVHVAPILLELLSARGTAAPATLAPASDRLKAMFGVDNAGHAVVQEPDPGTTNGDPQHVLLESKNTEFAVGGLAIPGE